MGLTPPWSAPTRTTLGRYTRPAGGSTAQYRESTASQGQAPEGRTFRAGTHSLSAGNKGACHRYDCCQLCPPSWQIREAPTPAGIHGSPLPSQNPSLITRVSSSSQAAFEGVHTRMRGLVCSTARPRLDSMLLATCRRARRAEEQAGEQVVCKEGINTHGRQGKGVESPAHGQSDSLLLPLLLPRSARTSMMLLPLAFSRCAAAAAAASCGCGRACWPAAAGVVAAIRPS